ncbi:hypothetical protein CAPTEDRAFT_212588 [Capitella teleta]|uniref:Uncharacterized protein n=1 Tax=Capitella teleta TaxID=283909 RepID=R7TG99_CAPTE|nr:hypothetical protein CAPTEDRAFT_212588 [Capitella teleta]|eukprot:ELT92517.1 hypothetical protein CAPTEDRAFT_212588 [Capitella teleta]
MTLPGVTNCPEVYERYLLQHFDTSHINLIADTLPIPFNDFNQSKWTHNMSRSAFRAVINGQEQALIASLSQVRLKIVQIEEARLNHLQLTLRCTEINTSTAHPVQHLLCSLT